MSEEEVEARTPGEVEPPKLKVKFWKNPKKRLIFIIILGVVIIAAAGAFWYWWNLKHPASITEKDNGEVHETVMLYPAPLDGVMTDLASSQRHPLGIMVENHVDARPQAGLDKADVVYEAIAEGGITRFLALFGSNEADKVGPVRSARTYYVDWAEGYPAYLAHVGGNIDALDKIKADKVLDLDQFAYSSSYWREYKKGVSSEHTMYTSTSKLRDQAAKNSYATANNFKIYTYKDDPKPESAEFAALPASQQITVNFSQPSYNVLFTYDKVSNSYLRNQAGVAHTDQASGKQLNPKNIVVMTVQRKPTVTRINESGWIMDTVGEGVAKIFLDGKEIDGKWKKTSKDAREVFYDATGTEITFDRGQLWICAIPPDSTVSVTP